MKAMILAAGLGTRLKPWTLDHPKALFPIVDTPMLERVILQLKGQGIREFVVNVHHFADQIEDFLRANGNFGLDITVSDERDKLLETGGAILKARKHLEGKEPFIVQNADILTDFEWGDIMHKHIESGIDASLICNDRSSTRKLIADSGANILEGWHNLKTDEYRWKSNELPSCRRREYAFNGIYMLSGNIFDDLEAYGEKFSIMEYFLGEKSRCMIEDGSRYEFVDIGKPENTSRAIALATRLKANP